MSGFGGGLGLVWFRDQGVRLRVESIGLEMGCRDQGVGLRVESIRLLMIQGSGFWILG